MDLLIAIPLKPFGVAKARLSPVLNAGQRSRLGRTIAAHTIAVAAETGAKVAVITSDDTVGEWAVRQGAELVTDRGDGGLDGAASAATMAARLKGQAWAILHADLPLLIPTDLQIALAAWRRSRFVLSPSYDGGTSLIIGEESFPFSYGPDSFHRHLRSAPRRAEVIVRRGLALDLDTPRDLETALDINPQLATAWKTVKA